MRGGRAWVSGEGGKQKQVMVTVTAMAVINAQEAGGGSRGSSRPSKARAA